MDHIIKLIGEYAGDLESLQSAMVTRDSKIRRLEEKVESTELRLEVRDGQLEVYRELTYQGYSSYEIDQYET